MSTLPRRGGASLFLAAGGDGGLGRNCPPPPSSLDVGLRPGAPRPRVPGVGGTTAFSPRSSVFGSGTGGPQPPGLALPSPPRAWRRPCAGSSSPRTSTWRRGRPPRSARLALLPRRAQSSAPRPRLTQHGSDLLLPGPPVLDPPGGRGPGLIRLPRLPVDRVVLPLCFRLAVQCLDTELRLALHPLRSARSLT